MSLHQVKEFIPTWLLILCAVYIWKQTICTYVRTLTRGASIHKKNQRVFLFTHWNDHHFSTVWTVALNEISSVNKIIIINRRLRWLTGTSLYLIRKTFCYGLPISFEIPYSLHKVAATEQWFGVSLKCQRAGSRSGGVPYKGTFQTDRIEQLRYRWYM